MQSVYLSEVILTQKSLSPVPKDFVEDDSVMQLPLCPLCLEKLDCSASGLSSASTILHEAFIAEPGKDR
jgi:hypothetical protein